MKILVMGAGAIGGYVGGHLAASGEDVIFCARGQNLRALQEHGLEINGVRGELRLAKVIATDNPRQSAPYDLILFCVKSYDTEEAARQIAGSLKAGAAVMTLQNGIENEHRLAAMLGAENVMAGNSRIGAELVAPGHIKHTSSGWVDFGELDGRESERARNYKDVFERAEIFGRLIQDFPAARWEKLVGNCGFNVAAALTRRRLGDLLDDPGANRLMRTLMSEALTVAHAEGATVSEELIDRLLNHGRDQLKENRPSTLQDLNRGKRLEYDAISGAVLRAARRHSIAVPVTQAMYALLKMLDGAGPESQAK
ncbi:MAG: ketopantoate reductase family protein [Candidatus Binataceae bacterium]